METYVSFKNHRIFLNKFTTSFLVDWWSKKKWRGTSKSMDYGVKLYFDKCQIWDLILFLYEANDSCLSFAVESLTELVFSMEDEVAEFYFN